MKNSNAKNDAERFQLQADFVQAIAHPIRLAVVDVLRDGEVCVCEIAGLVGAERSNVSRHLAVMLRAGILKTRKEGLNVYYSLRTPCVLEFLSCAAQAVGQCLAEDVQTLEQINQSASQCAIGGRQ